MNQLTKTPLGVFPRIEAYDRLKDAGIEVNSETLIALCTEAEIYKPHPDHKGLLKFVGRKKAQELWEEIESLLPYYIPDWKDRFDYIGISAAVDLHSSKDEAIPLYQNIACYVVPGSNEGDYLHVDLIMPGNKIHRLFLGKTFLGAGTAWEVAIAISTILSW
jgi:hypothetical protein